LALGIPRGFLPSVIKFEISMSLSWAFSSEMEVIKVEKICRNIWIELCELGVKTKLMYSPLQVAYGFVVEIRKENDKYRRYNCVSVPEVTTFFSLTQIAVKIPNNLRFKLRCQVEVLDRRILLPN